MTGRQHNQLWLNDSNSPSPDISAGFGRGERSNLILDSLPYRLDAPIGDLVGNLRKRVLREPTLLD